MSLLSGKESEKLYSVKSKEAIRFVENAIALCEPSSVFINTGSPQDIQYIREKAITDGEEIRTRKHFQTVHFDSPLDQARDREHTYIASSSYVEGVNYMARERALSIVNELFRGSMKGREMLVGFYLLGPKGSALSIPAVQITDSAYVMHSENLLYRAAYDVFTSNENLRPFFFIHSEGELTENKTSKNIDKRAIIVDTDGEVTYSINTQYAGNTVGLKKLALRLGIARGIREGWLMEHMLLVGINGPGGRRSYFSAAFPSMSGKTSTAMMEGEALVGDDISIIMNVSGEARAINVDKGVFGVIDGINSTDDPIIWGVLHSDAEIIFSNVLLTDDGDVRWNGDGLPPPGPGVNYEGRWWPGKLTENGKPAPISNPNARFTVSLDAFPNLDSVYDDPKGVKVSGIVFGARDYDTMPTLLRSSEWDLGVTIYGACLETATTAAVLGAQKREFNPMAINDFMSVPIGRYIENYYKFGASLSTKPDVFWVNYFLTDGSGRFLSEKKDKRAWFKWMELSVNGEAVGIQTPIGQIPLYDDLARIFSSLGKEYKKELYDMQFTLRVSRIIERLERARAYYRNFRSTPERFYEILDGALNDLVALKDKFGQTVSPSTLLNAP